MRVAIVLGRWLNDDGTISKILVRRLEMAIELYNSFQVKKLIVSGGVANKKALVSEASQMKKFLMEKGIPEEDIILEDKSTTTTENAIFSIPKAKELKADVIIICTTKEHFVAYDYNVIKIFEKAIGKSDIRLMVYTDCETEEE